MSAVALPAHPSVLLLYLLGMTSRPTIIHSDHMAIVHRLSMNTTLLPGLKPHLVHGIRDAYRVMVVITLICKVLRQRFFITCLRRLKGNLMCHYLHLWLTYSPHRSDSTFMFKSRSPGYATWGDMASKLEDEAFRAEYVCQSTPLPELRKTS
jgi:hypothetical protein